MQSESTDQAVAMPEMLAVERQRLVHLCGHLSDNAGVAEDLAQETLLEAWRHREELREPERYAEWLSGIARNVCLRWQRRHLRETGRYARADGPGAGGAPDLSGEPADGINIEVEMERHELAALLDRALALLSPETRALLIQRYVDASPHAEIAARLGMGEGTVKVKLHRGKLALRRVLRGELREYAAPYIAAEPDEPWQETRIWCPVCGRRRLSVRLDRVTPYVAFRCGSCCAAAETIFDTPRPDGLDTLTSYKAILTRQLALFQPYLWQALSAEGTTCRTCHHPVRAQPYHGASARQWPLGSHGLTVTCPRCASVSHATLHGLLLHLPETQRFWRQYPRMRAVPERELDVEGQPAMAASFESLSDGVRLTITATRDAYRILCVYRENVP
jgi:RNA polymerase sigma-70 factor (ECF subfamily)